MVNIQTQFTALKATWVKRILDSDDIWSSLGKYYIENFGKENLLLFTNNTENEYLKKLPSFYQQVFKSQIEINNTLAEERLTEDTIYNNPIWQNKYITITEKGKQIPIYFKNWIEAGLIFIKDLKFKNGALDENHCFKTVKKTIIS